MDPLGVRGTFLHRRTQRCPPLSNCLCRHAFLRCAPAPSLPGASHIRRGRHLLGAR